MINKARPIRQVLQRFNKKGPATAEEPDECDLASLMTFVEDETLQTLSKHLFSASGAMYSIATHLMTLQTLFSHPAEFARRHRESPEVQGFKQNPYREWMVAYIASQTLTHNEIVAEDEQGANIWDILTQCAPSRDTRAIAPLWDIVEEQGEDAEEPDKEYPYEDDHEGHMYHLSAIGEHDEEDDELQEKSPSTRLSHRPNTRSSSPNRIPNPITSLALCLTLRRARPQRQVRKVCRQLISEKLRMAY